MPLLRLALWAVVMAVVTRVVGWWGVPLVAAAAVLVPAAGRATAGGAALAAALAWGGLLTLGAAGTGFAALGGILGRLFSLPWPAVLALTLALPALLAWCAAALVEGAVAQRAAPAP
jgi:hypothetical protein